MDGWNNCLTSKCSLLTCIYCCDCNAAGCFFLHKCGSSGWEIHSYHGANPTLMPSTDPPDLGLGRVAPLVTLSHENQHKENNKVSFCCCDSFAKHKGILWRKRNYKENIFLPKKELSIFRFHCKNTTLNRRCRKKQI